MNTAAGDCPRQTRVHNCRDVNPYDESSRDTEGIQSVQETREGWKVLASGPDGGGLPRFGHGETASRRPDHLCRVTPSRGVVPERVGAVKGPRGGAGV